MDLPAYYAAKALERLQNPVSERKLNRILKLLDIDLVEPGPAPDFERLRNPAFLKHPENERADTIVFTGELSVLGVTVPMTFRLTYVGEFGSPEEIYDDFAYVSLLEVLSWEIDARSPTWKELDHGVFASGPIRDALLDLVLDRVKSNAYPR